jgi:hypothetical protein
VTPTPPAVPAVDVALPDLSRWAAGNAGVPYVWRFGDDGAMPRVLVQALTHGNEVCGAIALDWLLRSGFRPAQGALTLVFANTAAYQTFDAGDPFASRCLDEDFNRIWDAAVLDGSRCSRELARARELRPFYDRTDFLLDLHSMTDPCPALVLAGRRRKGRDLALALGMPQYVIVDAGHQAGRRLRDYAQFDDPLDTRNALLVECGQHWEAAAPIVAQQVMLRFLPHFEMMDRAFIDAHVDAGELPADDRDHRRRDDRDRRVRVRGTGGRHDVHCPPGHADRARRRARNPHAARRLCADHADAPSAQG